MATQHEMEWAAAPVGGSMQEEVARVLGEHQPSETPGRCTCGFWNVIRHEFHQAAVLESNDLILSEWSP